MKKIAQISLFFLVMLALFFFNKIYFSKNNKTITKSDLPENQLTQETENNLIKNLKYEVMLNQDNQYIITADSSELINFKIENQNDIDIQEAEMVKMHKVKAIIIDQNKIPLIIVSDNAEYNNFNHNTKFRNNVSIKYLNNKIYSDKLDLNIENNMVNIFENVRYIGAHGTITSDNIKINLISKKIDIYMDSEINNVEVNKK